MVLGNVGDQVYCRCRDCGMDQYLDTELFELENEYD